MAGRGRVAKQLVERLRTVPRMAIKMLEELARRVRTTSASVRD